MKTCEDIKANSRLPSPPVKEKKKKARVKRKFDANGNDPMNWRDESMNA